MSIHNWFLTKVTFEKTAEEGKIVTVSETNLVDALSFTEAESRIIEETTPFISGEFKVASCRRARISEIFYNENGDYWFMAKVAFITLDEEKGVEKRTVVSMLVQATDIDEACAGLKEGMKGSMADYRVLSMTETPIIDIFKHKTPEES